MMTLVHPLFTFYPFTFLLFYLFTGSVDISWGIVATTSLEGCTHRLSMQVTAYILGTIVTRMCAVMHAIKLQPGRLYLGLSIMLQGLTRIAGRAECRGKAFLAIISMLFSTEGCAALAPGYLHRQAMCIAFQASLSCHLYLSCEPFLPFTFLPFYLFTFS